MGIKGQSEKWIKRDLIALIAVIFLFYGGLSCLYATFVPHLIGLGFGPSERRSVLIVVALISCIGPALLGPLFDRLADRRKTSFGRSLRLVLAFLLILGAISYSLLLLVPAVRRSPRHQPAVSFGCDANGAIVFQERCAEEKTCYHWDRAMVGSLKLTNCSYTCQNPAQFEKLYNPWSNNVPAALEHVDASKSDEYEYDDNAQVDGGINNRPRRLTDPERVYVEPPHICTKQLNSTGFPYIDKCHVYTSDLDHLELEATLRGATNNDSQTNSTEWCNYPLDGFSCNIPQQQVDYMKHLSQDRDCKPMIECELADPYDSRSVLAQSRCVKIEGDPEATFWTYLAIRSLADIFPVSIIVLLNTAIIIATRETSSGRSEIGQQLTWGAIAWAIFPSILAICGIHDDIFVPVIICAVLWAIAALILLLPNRIPLDPPEWWWHTKSGMMAIPLSAIRKFCPEIIAVSVVAVILGAFWSIIDAYQPSYLLELDAENAPLVIKIALTDAALLSIFILYNVERIVDYCGHAHILIAAFAVYIIRFTILALMDSPWYALFTHSLESFTIVLVFITLVLIMRHLFPRRLIATGQAVPVIAIFCIGNAIGKLQSSIYYEQAHVLFRNLAIVAALIGTAYFVLYHCYLARRCTADSQPPPSPAELQTHDGIGQTSGDAANTSNGNNYSPLRIYHNSSARNGQFRY